MGYVTCSFTKLKYSIQNHLSLPAHGAPKVELGLSRKSHRSEAETADDVLQIVSLTNIIWRNRNRTDISIHGTTQLNTPCGTMDGDTQANSPSKQISVKREKPLKENREQASLKPENHYNVSRRDLPAIDNPLSIRAFLFLWVWEIWNPWEKLWGIFKARCLLVNQVLCLDVQNTAFFAIPGVKGKAAEAVWPKQSSMRKKQINPSLLCWCTVLRTNLMIFATHKVKLVRKCL